MANEWTPYGLERLRVGAIRRRRVFAILVLLLLGVSWLIFSMMNVTRTTETAFGNGGSTLDVGGPKKRIPVTLSVSPGRMTPPQVVSNDAAPPVSTSPFPQDSVRRSYAPQVVPLGFYLNFLLPLLLLAGLAWLLSRARSTGPNEEVNYGIYKGAMPFEMITASYRHLVITTRPVDGSPFGKEAVDYVPASTRLPEATLAWQEAEAI